eukprot:3921482-Alexandrium_andersonii.AAC.1
MGTSERHHYLVAIFTLLRGTQLEWKRRRRQAKEAEMDALLQQGLSFMKDLGGLGAAPRLWGSDLPPDSVQAWAALAKERRIWEKHSGAFSQGDSAYRAVCLAVEYEHADLPILSADALREEHRMHHAWDEAWRSLTDSLP